MKIKPVLAEIMVCAGLVLLNGCKKEQPASETQPAQATEGIPAAAAKAVDAAKTAATQVVSQATTQMQAAQQQVKTAVTQLTDQATAQSKAAEQQAQTLIDRAKQLVGEQKYQDALNSLNQLANTKLTADQQTWVENLKKQIQSALAKASATNAASALQGVLGGKK